MPKVEFYKKKNGFCPFCDRAESLLRSLGCHDITFVYIDESEEKREEFLKRCGPSARTVPQIFIHGVHVGGSDALAKLHKEGALVPLLSSVQS